MMPRLAFLLRPERIWDAAALALLALLTAFLAHALPGVVTPVAELAPIQLDPWALPDYALRSTLRMFAALGVSLAFTFLVAPLAAKSRHAGMVLFPLLDVLQSIPVLAFVSLAALLTPIVLPGTLAGAELAAVLTIATSQAWNMAFSLAQSLRTVPVELDEVARGFQLTAWQRFWRLEVPTALPGLVWNTMVSVAGGWFFVVAAEAVTVNGQTWRLPGLGSYVAQALAARNVPAVLWALGAMLIVILLCDQLMFRPLAAWAGTFRQETTRLRREDDPFIRRLLRRSPLLAALGRPIRQAASRIAWLKIGTRRPRPDRRRRNRRWFDIAWLIGLGLVGVLGMAHLTQSLLQVLRWQDGMEALILGLFTFARVAVTLILSTLIWVPLGVAIGLRPALVRIARPAAQVLAAFPANLAFPLMVVLIVRHQLNPDIWLTPLMLLGAQWYVLFNVLAGVQALPGELREASRVLQVRGLVWWRRVILPAIMPYLATGLITAAGGAWNASIIAESVSWGDRHVMAHGLGAYIAEATARGDAPRLVLGVFILSRLVMLTNAALWQPLTRLAQRRAR